MAEYNVDLDFNFEDDSKEPGLVPDGTYHGNIISVAYDPERMSIAWKVTLVENGGVCTDDETEIDGCQLTFNNWLPRPGDENEMTASGRTNKRQSKINMMAEFMKKMNLSEATVGEVITAVENAEYVGLEVDLKVGTREWQGAVFNEIQKMYAA